MELLSPAGSLKSLRYCFAYGSDAVYAGLPRYSLRVRNNEFNHENLAIGIKEAKELNKKFYLVANIAPHNSKINTFVKDIAPVIDMQPDALIISDPGILKLILDNFPKIPIHLSVQANVINWASVMFWRDLGVSRVILSRELSLDEIAIIKEKVPGIELEVFIHGALCVAHSGRCLLSGYLNKRDANQGVCANVCRWKYNLSKGIENELGEIIPQNFLEKESPVKEAYILEEVNRPNLFMPIFEDEHGTYIMNSKDLKAIEHIASLKEIGVDSIKIEGRTKSYYYAARTAQIYRQALDDALQNKTFNPQLSQELDLLANRGYTDGFLKKSHHGNYQNYEHSDSRFDRQRFVGEFTGLRKNGLAEIMVKNKFSIDENLDFISPSGNHKIRINLLKNKKDDIIQIAPGDGHLVYADIDSGYNLNYALLAANYLDK